MTVVTEELRSLVTTRHRYLSYLAGEPKLKPEMVSHLGQSRSTVDYAIRELLEAHFVERTEGKYRTTLMGRLAHDAFESYVSRLETLQETCRALKAQSPDSLSDSIIFEDAVVLLPKPHAPQWPLKEFLTELVEARHVRGFSPVMFEPYISTFHGCLVDADVSLEVVLPPDVLKYLSSTYADEFAEMLASGDLEVYESTRPVPFGLWIYEGANRCRVAVVFHDEGGLAGVVMNDSDEICCWARDQYDQVGTDARKLITPSKG